MNYSVIQCDDGVSLSQITITSQRLDNVKAVYRPLVAALLVFIVSTHKNLEIMNEMKSGKT